MLKFACISPHPPILLPHVGSPADRKQVQNTITALERLEEELKTVNPDKIIISSPHPDWGFNVPLYFLAKDFQGKLNFFLTGTKSPQSHFKKGKTLPQKNVGGRASHMSHKIAVIASGDLSHCLKDDSPYGYHPHGPKFDEELIESLKKKDITSILKLNDKYPSAAECGLRSFCFLLGILEARKEEEGKDYAPEILSYEAPFGVGYLVVNFKTR